MNEEIKAEVFYVNPREATKKGWRVGCKYIATHGECRKCGNEHDLTLDEYSQIISGKYSD